MSLIWLQVMLESFKRHAEIFGVLLLSTQLANFHSITCSLLKSVTWIHPHVRDYSKIGEVLLCASQLVQVIKEEEKAKLREEFMDYCTSEIPPHLTETSTQEMSIDTYWHKIGELKDDSGELKYRLLSKLAKSILIIPHGNADVERIFSHMGLNKTKVRNSLGVDTLTALLRLQYNVKEPCFSFKPTQVMVSRCRNAIASLNSQ